MSEEEVLRTNRNLKYWEFDSEVINLCFAINSIEGLHTIDSCCGHGKNPYNIFFRIRSLENLKTFLYAIDEDQRPSGWDVQAYLNSLSDEVMFLLTGPVGDFQGAEKIAKMISKYLSRNLKPRKGRFSRQLVMDKDLSTNLGNEVLKVGEEVLG